MKTALTLILIILFLDIYAQDTLKAKQIDTLVSSINKSNLPVKCDTVVKDYPEFGLKMITFLSRIVNDNELIKYVNLVDATRTENGVVKQTTTSSTFYYKNNKLIKIEEYTLEGKQKKTADWYYHEDKPIHFTATSAKASERAIFLITLANGFLKKTNE